MFKTILYKTFRKLRNFELVTELKNNSLSKLINRLKTINSDIENYSLLNAKERILESYEILLNETIEEMKKSTQFNSKEKEKTVSNLIDKSKIEDKLVDTIINDSDFLISNTQSMQLMQLDYLNTIKEESFEEGVNTQEHDYNENSNEKNNFSTPNTKEKLQIYGEDLNEVVESKEFKDDEYFLPSSKEPHKNTLVLDLDETLVHYVEDSENAFIQVRPGAEDFLEEMANYYELVIFTAAMQDVSNKYI